MKFQTAVHNGEVIAFKHSDGWHSKECACYKCYEAWIITNAQIRQAKEIEVKGEVL